MDDQPGRFGSFHLPNGHSFTNLFWPISDALRGFPASILLDGEVIAINDKGPPDFGALQHRLRPQNGKRPGLAGLSPYLPEY